MTIRLNNEPRDLPDGATLVALLEELGHAGRQGVAAAVNDTVIPRSAWPAHTLRADDRVLIVQAAQGG